MCGCVMECVLPVYIHIFLSVVLRMNHFVIVIFLFVGQRLLSLISLSVDLRTHQTLNV